MPTSSFSVTTPSANSANANGFVQADAFYSPITLGTPIGTDGSHSKGPLVAPYGIKQSGPDYNGFQTVAAAGATQGAAGAISASGGSVVIVTVTASTEGVKLPTAVTNLCYNIVVPGSVGTKIYPGTNAKIDATATNGSIALVAGKGSLFLATSTTQWRVILKGA